MGYVHVGLVWGVIKYGSPHQRKQRHSLKWQLWSLWSSHFMFLRLMIWTSEQEVGPRLIKIGCWSDQQSGGLQLAKASSPFDAVAHSLRLVGRAGVGSLSLTLSPAVSPLIFIRNLSTSCAHHLMFMPGPTSSVFKFRPCLRFYRDIASCRLDWS